MNYERLLELAMLKNNVEYRIVYPHGCCHLLPTNARIFANSITINPSVDSNTYSIESTMKLPEIRSDGLFGLQDKILWNGEEKTSFSQQAPSVFVFANSIVSNGLPTNLTGQSTVTPIHSHQYFNEYLMELSQTPVMSLFEAQKRGVLLGGDFLEEQRQLFRQQCRKADVVIVIGIQYREHDLHIWDALGETNGTVVYCSGASATQEFKRWLDTQKKAIKHEIIEGYFREKFEEICKIVNI